MFLHVLYDLWDFHTKSLFLAFNIREAEYPPPFLVFIVSGVSGTQLIKGKKPRRFFFGRKAMERRPKRGEPRGPRWVGPRGQVQGPRGTHQQEPRAPPRLGLFMHAFVFPEKGRPNFPDFIRGRGGGETPDSLRGGVRSCCSGEGEIIAIVITSPPWRGRRPLHHHHRQDQHHLHHHLRDPLRSPHNLRVAIP